MNLRRKIAATTLAGLMVSGVAAPAWADALYDDILGEHADAGIPALDFDEALDDLKLWVQDEDRSGAVVIVTPGTNDTGLGPRTAGLTGNRENWIVRYPESLWPVASGRSDALLPLFAPTYDESRAGAVEANAAIMRALKDVDRVVVYTGYSQGADALGNAAEQANGEGVLGDNTLILLVSDPRGPWGLKPGLQKIPGIAPLMAIIGADNDGARDPKDTGDAEVVQVIVAGDPVANWQWNPLRPASSLLVDLAGFITIHGGTGPYSYANIHELTLDKTLSSAEGNTTYEVYDTYHPLALLNLMIADALGIPVTKDQLEEWDRRAERFYPLQAISPETADPGVEVVTDKPEGRHTLRDSNGDPVESVTSLGATADDAPYVPRHAAPYTPRHAAPEPVQESPADQGSAVADAPTTTSPEADGTSDIEPVAPEDPEPTSEDPEPAPSDPEPSEEPAADTATPSAEQTSVSDAA